MKKYMSPQQRTILKQEGQVSMNLALVSKPVLQMIRKEIPGFNMSVKACVSTLPHYGRPTRGESTPAPANKHIMRVFRDMPCRIKKSSILGDIDVEILYPEWVWKMIERWRTATGRQQYENKVKSVEKKIFRHFEPLIKKYGMNYNEVSYAAELTFNHLFIKRSLFTKELYQEIIAMLPEGFDVCVHYNVYHECLMNDS